MGIGMGPSLALSAAALAAVGVGSPPFRGVPQAMTPPAALRWSPASTTLFMSSTGYGYAPEPTGPFYVTVAKLYVDLQNVTGAASDNNAGTSQAAPLATLVAARAKIAANGTDIICFGHKSDVVLKETASWVAPNFDYRCINAALPYRITQVRVANVIAPMWVATMGQPGVYQTLISAADVSSMVDLANKVDLAALVQVPVNGTALDQAHYRAKVNAAPASYHVPTLVGSIAAVAATPGTRYYDAGTGTVFVQAIDSRNLANDAGKMLALAGGVYGRSVVAAGRTQEWEGFDWIGGTVPFFVSTGNNTTNGVRVRFKNCSFQASAATQNGGLQVSGVPFVTIQRCTITFNYNDGGNYHNAGNVQGDPSVMVLEVDSVFGFNGTTGSVGPSENDSTLHERCTAVSQGCVYLGSRDRVVADIDEANRWMIGCYIGSPRQSTGVSLASLGLGGSAIVWLDGCHFAPALNGVHIRAEQTTAVYYRNMGPMAQITTAISAGATFQPY